jgi:hypothetical protein
MYFNSHSRLVFMASTKEINNKNTSSKKLTHIPCGKFKHVRFDIHDYDPSNENYDKTLSEYWSELRERCDKENQTTQYQSNPLCPIPLIAAKCSSIKIKDSQQCFLDVYQPVYDDGIMPKCFLELNERYL